jgi:hypothetical protein
MLRCLTSIDVNGTPPGVTISIKDHQSHPLLMLMGSTIFPIFKMVLLFKRFLHRAKNVGFKSILMEVIFKYYID